MRQASNPYRNFRPSIAPSLRTLAEAAMLDFAFFSLGLAGFGLLCLYAYGCNRL